jgi:hypothetical protein
MNLSSLEVCLTKTIKVSLCLWRARALPEFVFVTAAHYIINSENNERILKEGCVVKGSGDLSKRYDLHSSLALELPYACTRFP